MTPEQIVSNLRFLYTVASLAHRTSLRFNGPAHPRTRQLASELEFAHARFSAVVAMDHAP